MEKVNTLVSGLTRLKSIAQHIERYDNDIPLIEIDLFMQELRNLYLNAMELEQEVSKNEQLAESIVEKTVVENQESDIAVTVMPIVDEVPTESANEQPQELSPSNITPTEVAPEPLEETDAEPETLPEEMSDTPPYAPAEKHSEPTTLHEPIMENIEGQKYDELFFESTEKAPVKDIAPQEEPVIDAPVPADPQKEVAEPVVEPVPVAKPESPAPQPAPVSKPEPPAPQPVPVSKPEPPAPQPAAAPQSAPAPQPAPAAASETSKSQSSLFSYLNNRNQQTAATTSQSQIRTLGDTFTPNTASIDAQLSSQVNSHRVSDLRTVININDKFSFINELFHYNMKGYNDFITQLNEIQDRQVALQYVEEVAQQNRWVNDSPTVQTFMMLFDRKF